MKIIATRDMSKNPIQVFAGDTFQLHHTDHNGKTTKVLSRGIDEPMTIDIAHVVEIEKGELGLECGIGGVFGTKQK